jgi:phosphoribosylaminoimidazolecarboxamide formyltransferase/IMP cyclohydrolase
MTITLKRALLSCSDKTGLTELAKALHDSGTELFASGRTFQVLNEAKIPVKEATQLSRNPETFAGRVKTLSFHIFGGILARRNDPKDEAEMKRLEIPAIDAVIVNFYPFEKQADIENIDIGGPALVRAAAKNAPHVLCVTDPSQYLTIISDLKNLGGVSEKTSMDCARRAWSRISQYDQSIDEVFGETKTTALRYGENPHQKAWIKVDSNSPIQWSNPLTLNSLSYNNILDVSAAYSLARELKLQFPEYTHTVIVKHGNPCGVASILKSSRNESLLESLELAWKSDPISAFGGVLVFTEPLSSSVLSFLSERFVEVLAAPDLTSESLAFQEFSKKRKGLKAVSISHWDALADHQTLRVSIPGGELIQTSDQGLNIKETIHKNPLVAFGILVTRALKSNAIGIFNRPDSDSLWLVGAGQGQPNRIDSLKTLAIDRAQKVLGRTELTDCLLVSDAFFPFRDSIDEAAQVKIPIIVQPGGSIRDAEVIGAAESHGIELVLTGVRHFRH